MDADRDHYKASLRHLRADSFAKAARALVGVVTHLADAAEKWADLARAELEEAAKEAKGP